VRHDDFLWSSVGTHQQRQGNVSFNRKTLTKQNNTQTETETDTETEKQSVPMPKPKSDEQ
jgi:hypothetical protein